MIDLWIQERKAYTCIKSWGHFWHIIFPLQYNKKTNEIFCRCPYCLIETLIKLPPDVCKQILRDISRGKLKILKEYLK